MKKSLLLSCLISMASLGQTQWIQKANVPDNLCNAVGFAIGNNGYLGCGWNPMAVKNFYKYNSLTNTWTQIGSFPGNNIGYSEGFAINGKGYVAIGQSTTSIADVWEFDPATSNWTQKASFPIGGRTEAASFVIGNKAYIVSGSGPTRIYNNDLYEFDPAANTWTQKASVPAPGGWGRAGFSIGNMGYLCTGTDSLNSSLSLYEYDPANNSWTQKANFPGIGRMRGTSFSVNGKGYVGGGIDPINGTVSLTDFYEYNPASNTWTTIASLTPKPRQSAVSLIINGSAYVGTGGDIGAPYYNDFWQLSIKTVTAGVGENETAECLQRLHENLFLPDGSSCDVKSIEIFDVSGKMAVSLQSTEELNNTFMQLQAGIYLVRICAGKGEVRNNKIAWEGRGQ